MIAVLVLAMGVTALANFSFFYCQTVLHAALPIEISQNVRTLSGMEFGRPAMDCFRRAVLLIRLCPPLTAERTRELRAVRVYCAFLYMLGLAAPPLLSREGSWLRREAATCAHFAAVALDERILRMRQFCEQSLGNPVRR